MTATMWGSTHLCGAGSAPVNMRGIKWRSDVGMVTVKGLLTLALVAGFVYTGMKFVPIWAASFQFDDAMREQIALMQSGRQVVSLREVQTTILARAKELGIPVDKQNLIIEQCDRTLRLVVDYTVRIELIGGHYYDWRFTPEYETVLHSWVRS